MRLAPPSSLVKPVWLFGLVPEVVAVRDCGFEGLVVVVVVACGRARLAVAVLLGDVVDAVLDRVGLARCATRLTTTVAKGQSTAATQGRDGHCHEEKTPREDTYYSLKHSFSLHLFWPA